MPCCVLVCLADTQQTVTLMREMCVCDEHRNVNFTPRLTVLVEATRKLIFSFLRAYISSYERTAKEDI